MSGISNPPAVAPAAKSRRLGRGLASLMSNTRETPPELAAPVRADSPAPDSRYIPVGPGSEPQRATEVPIDAIQPNPYQPRRDFDAGELDELASSIAQQGVLQPLLIARLGEDGGYTLIAGERRLRASKKAGLKTVPCVVRAATPEQMVEWALVENVQRRDLNPVELAKAYRDYLDRFSATQQDLAEHVAQPRSTVANYLRLLDLSHDVLSLVAKNELSFGHAKVLASLVGQTHRQISLARLVISEALSVRALEERIAGGGAAPTAAPSARSVSNKTQYVLDVERQISQAVSTKVEIKPGRSKNTGRIVLEYYNLDDFDRIVTALGAKISS
jgi:ParB family transcriptional regulator, chromosome partitioning protein